MKEEMTSVKIPLNPYPYDCLLVVGHDADANEFLGIHGVGKEFLDSHQGASGKSRKNDRDIILWICKPSISLLVHEAVHVVTLLFHETGVPISYDNDESLAYMLNYLVREAVEKSSSLKWEIVKEKPALENRKAEQNPSSLHPKSLSEKWLE